MMKLSPFFLAFFSLILFSTCKKEKDEVRPEIEFVFPATYSSYHVFETVFVGVNVSDDQKLERLSVDIIDQNNRRIVSEFSKLDFHTLEEEVNLGLELSDIHISSGVYNIRALVSDGENEHVIFREITIIEEPLQRERLLLVRQSLGQTYIDSLDLAAVVYPGIQLNSDNKEAVLNSYDQELMVIGDLDARIHLALGPQLSNITSLDFMGANANSFFNDVHFNPEDKKYFVSFTDGRIHEYGKNGSLKNSILTSAGRRPLKLFSDENYLYSEERSIDDQTRVLVMYHKSSGAFYQSITINFDIVGMHKIDNQLIIIANEDDVGIVARYYPQTNGLSIEDEEFDFIQTSLYGSFDNFQNRILIATNSEVSYINVETQYLWTGSAWNTGAKSLFWDPISGTVLSLNGTLLNILSSDGLINPVALGQEYNQVLVLYNK